MYVESLIAFFIVTGYLSKLVPVSEAKVSKVPIKKSARRR
jgi:hypothetical protein